MRHLPSLGALYASDDRQLYEELLVLAAREQAAIVRALADRLEHLAPQETSPVVGQEIVEELARLGCGILKTAATLRRATEPEPARSGILPASLHGQSESA